MTPDVEAAAAPLCDVKSRAAGTCGYCLTHGNPVAPGKRLCAAVEGVLERVVAAVEASVGPCAHDLVNGSMNWRETA